MTFKEYDELALATARYPNLGNNLVYPALGLCGESGEVAEKVKKLVRDGKYSGSLVAELGDVLWYISALARELGYSLEDVAMKNIEKLTDRQRRGVLGGEGDNR